jgi:magnesium-protoporphyrin IX monomethyl ester (oxidative) cyclase
MYVRDHTRPAFHRALGLDPTEYDYQVFRVCNEISKQVFPLVLDTDNPKFRARMDRLRVLAERLATAKARGGVLGRLQQLGLIAATGLTFAALYLMPTQGNEAPDTVRLAAAW